MTYGELPGGPHRLVLLALHLFQLLASSKSRGEMVFHRIQLPQGHYLNVYQRKDDLYNPGSKGDRIFLFPPYS